MINAGYYNLKSASQASSRATSAATSRRPSEKPSVTSTPSDSEEQQYEPQTQTEQRRRSLLKRALDQLKPLDEPITPTEGIYTPVIGHGFFGSKSNAKLSKAEKKEEAAKQQKARWSEMAKERRINENYSRIAAAV